MVCSRKPMNSLFSVMLRLPLSFSPAVASSMNLEVLDVEEGISLSLVFENPLTLGSRLVDLRFAEARGSKELDVRAFVTLEAGMIFSVAFHHKGKFVNGKKWQYRGGEIHVEHEIDTDRWSYFEAVGLVKDLGYKGLIKLWWKGKKESMKKSLKKLVEDNDAFELAAFAVNNKSEVDIYVEHVEENAEIVQGTEVNLNSNPIGSDKGPNVEKEADVNVVPAVNEGVVNVVPVVNEVPEVAGVNDMAGGNEDNELNYSSDGSVKGIHFSDSEEERGLGLDDGFDNAEIGEAEAVLNQQIENMKKNNVVVDMVGDGAPVKKKKTPRRGRMGSVGIAIDVERLAVNSFVPPNLNTMHAMDEEYNSDELDSELDDDNIDGVARPKYPTYNKEDMCKTFKFKLGMEFTSLKQFKEAILEHSVLNGRQVKFVKNDTLRVRVECTKNCDFTMLVSKVGDNSTYRMNSSYKE